MAKDKKSFLAYCDWMESFEELSDEEAGKLVKHLFRYVNDLNPETDDKLIKLCFIPIKQSLKRDLKKYDNYIEKQRANGAKGGRPKKEIEKPKKPKPFLENPTEPKKADSVNVSDSVIVNGKVNDTIKEITISPKKEKLFSEDVLNCYDCLINFFPENLWPKKKEDWLDTIDKLNRIDNVPFEKIIELTKKAREDCFWSGTFLSLKKLRTKNNDGIMYIVVFNEKFKKKKLTPTEKIFETAKKNLENW